MMNHLHNLEPPPGSTSSTSMVKATTSTKLTSAPQTSSAIKKSNKKLTWKTGFLPPQKPTLPEKTEGLPSPSSSQSQAIPMLALPTCNTMNTYSATLTNSPIVPMEQVIKQHNMMKSMTHRNFSQRYYLRVCLDGAQGQKSSKWETITTMLIKPHAIDKRPWRCQDNTTHPTIDLSATGTTTFFDLHMYVP